MKLTGLAGKKALVVGGSRGIGAAIVRELLSNRCRTAFTHKDPPEHSGAAAAIQRYAQEQSCECLDVDADCTNSDAMRSFVETVVNAWGGVNYLVYCAGYTSQVSLDQLTVEQWRRIVDINLNGAFIAVDAVLPTMLTQKSGSIVLIGSAAVRTGGGGRADYVSAKAGLEGFNLAITREYASKGIRCNVVHPSLIETDLLRHRYSDSIQRQEAGRSVPVGRLGRPEDISHLVCFLLSDCAGYITGQAILVDGGRSFCARQRTA